MAASLLRSHYQRIHTHWHYYHYRPLLAIDTVIANNTLSDTLVSHATNTANTGITLRLVSRQTPLFTSLRHG